ncbi:hypothetical protein QMK17_22825 [Rhodococcus sp. G-MC3]|uniref:hypothetical protein n=1 Tax=Rhodococcus sp. G-MC3 TaxID=3046209 RepID=UPI0024BAC41B|nr:hypothetical protein [Rhodococcus sp. G-MC3]MDJ0396157.1 hypothetical protein [Rhodococcus sp. G-MC3]
MKVEHLFVHTLIDLDQKLRTNPSEYDLLKVSALLRPILLDKPPLLDTASAAASLAPKFRVVKPGPIPIPAELKKQMDEAWAKLHETRPEIKRVDTAIALRFDLMTGQLGDTGNPGDQVAELSRQDFLKANVGFILNDFDYSVESMLRVAANSLGGVHNDGKPNRDKHAEELRQYMENGGAIWCGRTMPAAMIFEIARCTLRACKPIADEMARLGLCSAESNDWVWSIDDDGNGTARVEST